MNNFYTVLVIPEKTKQVKKVVVPTIYVRVGLLVGSVAAFFIAFMVYDYVNVMRQLSENKRLQTENRQLKQQLQTFTTKLQGVQDSLERIQTYTAKLRIITNQAGENVDTLKKKVAPEIPGMPMDDHSDVPPTKSIPSGREGANQPYIREDLGLMPPARSRLLASLSAEQAYHVANRAVAESSSSANLKDEEEKSEIAREKLSDLIREDEERESAELMHEFQKLRVAFESVRQHAVAVELDVQALTTALYDQRDYLNSMPTLKPTNGWYTSGFGTRDSPFTGKPNMHEGLDIANHVGSPIVSPAAGIITYAGPRAGYGNLVTIDHGYGIQTQFGHISRAYVKVGERVKRGHKIAAVGNTGRSTGPHVHYEVRVNGIPINPQFYILED